MPLRARFREWCNLEKSIKRVDIFDPRIEELRRKSHEILLEILVMPIASRMDARTMLAIVIACGTYNGAVRRALLGVLRFLQ